MLRILLAEDNPVNQKLAVLMLEKRGHRVTVANDGQEALEAVQQGRFDAVLMDVHMPRMGGFEAAAAIRAWERTAGGHVPIVALTALAMSGDRAKCLQAGMDAYVAKPVRAAELFETIERVCAGPAARPAKPDLRVVRGGVQERPVDEDLLMETLDHDLSSVHTMIEIFRASFDDQMRAIVEALSHDNAGALKDAAHTFKGSLFSVAARPAAAAALRLEMLGRSGDLGHAEEALAELDRELQRLATALDELMKRAA